MWERIRGIVDGSIVVTLDEVKSAMKLMASRVRIIAEGAGALPVAAALKETEGPVVAVVSGGNIDLRKFCELIS
jgi:threonine dehydratase